VTKYFQQHSHAAGQFAANKLY